MSAESARGSLALLATLLLLSPALSAADVVIDGSLPGTAREALASVQSAPDLLSIEIPAEKGHAVGTNLFHSFERFGIAAATEGRGGSFVARSRAL